MATTSTRTSGSARVAEAVRNVFSGADEDCVTVRYQGDEGPFHIQVANFPDGRWLNVCNFPDRPSAWEQIFGDPDPHPYTERLLAETELEVDDHGPMFVVLTLPDEGAGRAIDACRETARICDAPIASEQHVKSQTLRPGGWRAWLRQKVRGGEV